MKISDHLNMHQLIEEHDKVLNAAKEKGTTETIEELEKLHQNMEDKKGDVMEIGEVEDILMEKLKSLLHNFNEDREEIR